MTALDTAYNYGGFSSHRTLRITASDLLDEFEISTKVGFFPDSHDLTPVRLRDAIAQCADDLGRVPNTTLLHNPECSPADYMSACDVLADATEHGLCQAWGLSSWDPRALLAYVHHSRLMRPDVVMVRAGLTVPAPVLAAGEHLIEQAMPRELWGMAPFDHDPADPLWSTVDTRMFLTPDQQATTLQAGVAVAFALPPVTRLAVGTCRLDHLAELHQACRLAPNVRTVRRYRALLDQKATTVQAAIDKEAVNQP